MTTTATVNPQERAISLLQSEGFEWRHTSHEFGFQVYERAVGGTGARLHYQAEIDEEGFVNGQTVDAFLASYRDAEHGL